MAGQAVVVDDGAEQLVVGARHDVVAGRDRRTQDCCDGNTQPYTPANRLTSAVCNFIFLLAHVYGAGPVLAVASFSQLDADREVTT